MLLPQQTDSAQLDAAVGTDADSISDSPLRDDQAHLEERELENNHRRAEKAKDTAHYVFVIFIWSAGSAFLLLFLVRMWHFAVPESWCWLPLDRLQGIDKMLFSGAIGAVLSKYIDQALITRRQ